ncbi:MAG: transcription termination/antitermination protein NusA [Clostridiales bacterium]|nr:transcription termination/antitermination protein NusA [Clostridiales bacterium]
MNADLIYALEQLEKERGIKKDIVVEAIEIALASAYKKNFGASQNVRVVVDKNTGEIGAFALKNVVQEVKNDLEEISVEDAKKQDPTLEEGDTFEVEITQKKFGRIAAQTAKQVVLQRIREAERNMIYEEFSARVGDIVTGVIQRIEHGNIMIDLGKTEAILLRREQVPNEEYKFNDRVKVYIIDVKHTTKGSLVYVSRSCADLVKKLFELEVPEIASGLVEVKGITREAGSRTKIAVYCKDDAIDPIGACVGQKGTRVQNIVDELKNEKIDIIKWSNNPVEYIASSLSPADVMQVKVNEEDMTAEVVVPDSQLSLAIGKEGQNVRLAARLTGWKIDIKSASKFRETIEKKLLNINLNGASLFKESESEEENLPEESEPDVSDEVKGLFKDND